MKTSYTLASVFALLALSSCTLEPMEITKEELYTRSFIKTFGLISPDQDWNTAVRTEVPIKVDRMINSLKVYADVGGKYYLVADYRNVSKDIRIPVDIPEETFGLKVKADGHQYYGAVGQTIDCSQASSRAVHDEYLSETVDSYSVTVSRLPYVPFNAQQMGPIIAPKDERWPNYWSINDARMKYNTLDAYGLLPEKGVDDLTFGNGNNVAGNRNNLGITQDFVVEPETDGTFTIYPMYWNTATQHTLGIYLIDNEGQPIKKNGEIIKFPVYKDKEMDDIQIYLKGDITLDPSTVEMNAGETAYVTVKPNVAVSWTSSDTRVVTIDSKNRITALRSGTAVLTAATVGNKTAQCTVLVNSAGEPQTVTATLSFNQHDIIAITEQEGNPLQEHIHGTYAPRMNLLVDGGDEIDDDKMDHFVTDLAQYIQNNLEDFFEDVDKPVYHTHLIGGRSFTYTPAYTEIANYSNYDVSISPNKAKCGEYGFEGTITITKRAGGSAPKRGTQARSRADGMPSALVESGGDWVSIGVGDGVGNYGPMHYEAYTVKDPLLMRSRGLKVKVQGHTGKVGMYIDFRNYEHDTWTDRTFYSQRALNKHPDTKDQVNGESYACTFKHPESQRIYFSFEDWVNLNYNPYDNDVQQSNGWSDKDLNDLIFRITGFKSITDTGGSSEITEEDETIDWIWAVEDLGATDDFDFNDVVVKISSVTTNYTDEGVIISTSHKVTFKPLAAGGTLPIYLHWGGYVLKPGTYYETAALMPQDGGTYHLLSELASTSADVYSEYHRWFGEGVATKMLNTRSLTHTSQECTIYLSSEFSIDGFGSNTAIDGKHQTSGSKLFVSIRDPKLDDMTAQIDPYKASDESYVVAAPAEGAAPQMFIINGNNWRWPTERTHISKAYPLFDRWVGNKSVKWYDSPSDDSGLTIGY